MGRWTTRIPEDRNRSRDRRRAASLRKRRERILARQSSFGKSIGEYEKQSELFKEESGEFKTKWKPFVRTPRGATSPVFQTARKTSERYVSGKFKKYTTKGTELTGKATQLGQTYSTLKSTGEEISSQLGSYNIAAKAFTKEMRMKDFKLSQKLQKQYEKDWVSYASAIGEKVAKHQYETEWTQYATDIQKKISDKQWKDWVSEMGESGLAYGAESPWKDVTLPPQESKFKIWAKETADKIVIPFIPSVERIEEMGKTQYEKEVTRYKETGYPYSSKLFPKKEDWRFESIKKDLSFEEYKKGSTRYGLAVGAYQEIKEKPIKTLALWASPFAVSQIGAKVSALGWAGLASTARVIPLTATKVIGTVGKIVPPVTKLGVAGLYGYGKYKQYGMAETKEAKGRVIGSTGVELSAIMSGGIAAQFAPASWRFGQRALEIQRPRGQVAMGVGETPATERMMGIAKTVGKAVKKGYKAELEFKRELPFETVFQTKVKAGKMRIKLAKEQPIYQGSGVQYRYSRDLQSWKEPYGSKLRIIKDIDAFVKHPTKFENVKGLDLHQYYERTLFPFARDPKVQSYKGFDEKYIQAGEQFARKGVGMWTLRKSDMTGKQEMYRFSKDFNDFIAGARDIGDTKTVGKLTKLTATDFTVSPKGVASKEVYWSKPTQKLAEWGLVKPAKGIEIPQISQTSTGPVRNLYQFTVPKGTISPPPSPRGMSFRPSISPPKSISISKGSYRPSKSPSVSTSLSMSPSPSKSFSGSPSPSSSFSFSPGSPKPPSPSPPSPPSYISISGSPSLSPSPSPSMSPSISYYSRPPPKTPTPLMGIGFPRGKKRLKKQTKTKFLKRRTPKYKPSILGLEMAPVKSIEQKRFTGLGVRRVKL